MPFINGAVDKSTATAIKTQALALAKILKELQETNRLLRKILN